MNNPSRCCLTDVEKVWLAAIIDGEGCIRIGRTKRPKTRSGWRFTPSIEFTNTNVKLIDRFVELTQDWVTNVREYQNGGHDRNKRKHVVSIRYKACKIFIEAIKDFLIAKTEQADLMLEFIDLQRNVGQRNADLIPQFNEFYIKSRLLNVRGTAPLDVEPLRQDILTDYRGQKE